MEDGALKRYDRFTRKTRRGRGRIPRDLRNAIYERDAWTCVFCASVFPAKDLTIDHLIPLARGGTDDVTNYATCCRSCNQLKASVSLEEFARSVSVPIERLPVHGDPVIDNTDLPLSMRAIRKQIHDRSRVGDLNLGGAGAQRRLEKEFRRAFWTTPAGRGLEAQFPSLPGHVRVMLPEIQAIAKSEREFLLLVELSKSANTRNLIGSVLGPDPDLEGRVRQLLSRTRDDALLKRLEQAIARFERAINASTLKNSQGID